MTNRGRFGGSHRSWKARERRRTPSPSDQASLARRTLNTKTVEGSIERKVGEQVIRNFVSNPARVGSQRIATAAAITKETIGSFLVREAARHEQAIERGIVIAKAALAAAGDQLHGRT